jgi:hypothetical protein
MCLIAEICSLIFGIITLAMGKFTLTRTKVVKGAPAYVIGILLILPLPIAFGFAFVVVAMLTAQGNQIDPAKPPIGLVIGELGIFLVCFVTALIIAIVNARPEGAKRKPRREEFDEDEAEDRWNRPGDYDEEDRPRPRRPRPPDDQY